MPRDVDVGHAESASDGAGVLPAGTAKTGQRVGARVETAGLCGMVTVAPAVNEKPCKFGLLSHRTWVMERMGRLAANEREK